MSKMNFKNALKALATGEAKDHNLFVSCESYVAEIENWTVNFEEGNAYVYAHVRSVSGSMPFIPDEGKNYRFGEIVRWWLGTNDIYFTTEEEATAHAAECIFKYVKMSEDSAEE